MRPFVILALGVLVNSAAAAPVVFQASDAVPGTVKCFEALKP